MSLEASALTHASRLGLLGRRSPLLRLQGDERLIALMREGQERGFEALVERYQPRLLAFCRGMLGSSEDAEDVLQDVFVAAHAAILADNRPINARPWLYRIARNRCLNHLRKPVAEAQDSMDVHPHENGTSVADRVQKREEFRALIADVQGLPETQRTALLLREIDALAYEEIALAMETTVPAVKSLLVRARMSLADCSQGRHLTCDEVHLELAEAAEGLRKASGPARAHLRRCERCREYRSELRRNGRALAALAPIGPLAALHGALSTKLGLGGGKLGLGGAGSQAGASAGAAAAGGSGAMGIAGGAAAGGLGGALGTKAAAGVASVALLTAGAVEVTDRYSGMQLDRGAPLERTTAMAAAGPVTRGAGHVEAVPRHGGKITDEPRQSEAPAGPVSEPAPPESTEPAPEEAPPDGVAGGAETGTGVVDGGSGGGTAPGPIDIEPLPPSPLPEYPTPIPVEPPPVEPPPATPGALLEPGSLYPAG